MGALPHPPLRMIFKNAKIYNDVKWRLKPLVIIGSDNGVSPDPMMTYRHFDNLFKN